MRKNVYITHNYYDSKNRLLMHNVIDSKYYHSEGFVNTYDVNGNLVSVRDWVNEEIDTYNYNDKNQCTSITTYDTYDDTTAVTVKYEYDEKGRKIREAYPKHGGYAEYKYDDNDNIIYKDNYDGITTYKYDKHNNVIFEENEGSYISKYNNKYNKNCVLTGYTETIFIEDEKKPIVWKVKYKYDKKGNKVKAIERSRHCMHITEYKYYGSNCCYMKETYIYF